MKYYEPMKFDSIVVGGGIAGLTAACYLCRYGHNVLLLEKSKKVGGLVGSFERDGFVFDYGARAFENSGIILPMLKQLGIDMEIINNPVTIGIGMNLSRFLHRRVYMIMAICSKGFFRKMPTI